MAVELVLDFIDQQNRKCNERAESQGPQTGTVAFLLSRQSFRSITANNPSSTGAPIQPSWWKLVR